MQSKSAVAALVGALIAVVASTGPAAADRDKDKVGHENVQVGPRPFYLVDKMTDGELNNTLEQCKKGPFARTNFSIGHRGAGLQFPEHTRESYEAAIHMGAGIVECDAMTPGDYARGGEGVAIDYGFVDCPFGIALIMATEKGVCGLAFGDEGMAKLEEGPGFAGRVLVANKFRVATVLA